MDTFTYFVALNDFLIFVKKKIVKKTQCPT